MKGESGKVPVPLDGERLAIYVLCVSAGVNYLEGHASCLDACLESHRNNCQTSAPGKEVSKGLLEAGTLSSLRLCPPQPLVRHRASADKRSMLLIYNWREECRPGAGLLSQTGRVSLNLPQSASPGLFCQGSDAYHFCV